MKLNMIGSFVRNAPFGTEIAFEKGLKEIGVDVATWDPSSNMGTHWHSSPDAIIMFKDHGSHAHDVIEYCKSNGAISIVYQPDDMRAPGIHDMMKDLRDICDYAFTFDQYGAATALDLGYEKTEQLLLTADTSLYFPIEGIQKDIDFCFVGNFCNSIMHKSRIKMINLLKGAGHNVIATTTFDTHLINTLYNRSKVVINHATDVGQPFAHGYGIQCRHFEAGFTGAAFLTNSILDVSSDLPQNMSTFHSEDDLLKVASYLIKPVSPTRSGKKLYAELMKNHRPVHRARQIVNFIEGVKNDKA